MAKNKKPHYIIDGAHVAFDSEPSPETIAAVRKLIEFAYTAELPNPKKP